MDRFSLAASAAEFSRTFSSIVSKSQRCTFRFEQQGREKGLKKENQYNNSKKGAMMIQKLRHDWLCHWLCHWLCWLFHACQASWSDVAAASIMFTWKMQRRRKTSDSARLKSRLTTRSKKLRTEQRASLLGAMFATRGSWHRY